LARHRPLIQVDLVESAASQLTDHRLPRQLRCEPETPQFFVNRCLILRCRSPAKDMPALVNYDLADMVSLDKDRDWCPTFNAERSV
jgi:hypothetical protein